MQPAAAKARSDERVGRDPCCQVIKTHGTYLPACTPLRARYDFLIRQSVFHIEAAFQLGKERIDAQLAEEIRQKQVAAENLNSKLASVCLRSHYWRRLHRTARRGRAEKQFRLFPMPVLRQQAASGQSLLPDKLDPQIPHRRSLQQLQGKAQAPSPCVHLSLCLQLKTSPPLAPATSMATLKFCALNARS